jgi:hypothetical protein
MQGETQMGKDDLGALRNVGMFRLAHRALWTAQ